MMFKRTMVIASLAVLAGSIVTAPAWAADHSKATSAKSQPSAQTKSPPGAALAGITLPAIQTRPAPSQNKAVPDEATVFLVPGKNEIIPVARNHLNRIITPFAHPIVNTVSQAKIKAHDSVLYVATTQHTPITLFVRPRGREDMALSLTLVPEAIAPRQIKLEIKGASDQVYFSPTQAEHWEQAQPYVNTLVKVMRILAHGEIPSGYGFEDWHQGDLPSDCHQPGLTFKAGQYVSGAHLLVTVAKATNTASHRIQFQEARCQGVGVLAVAAWPRVSLTPGQSTEVYVIHQRPSHQKDDRKRPSLLK